MGLFGGGKTPKYERAYAKWATQTAQKMGQEAVDNALAAEPYRDLTAESDIAYDTASGQYLNANPYIDQVVGNTTQQIQDAYNKSTIPSQLSNWAGSGRFGSGLFQQSLADTQSKLNQDVANAASNIYYQNYNTERQFQEAARDRIASQYDPLNRYSAYGSLLQSATPSAVLGMKTKGSTLGNAVSGALSGAVSGGMMGGPWGALGGALAGGALGALG